LSAPSASAAPPAPRSPIGEAAQAAAAEADGGLSLQVCADCGAVQYPPREVCRACLSGALHWREVAGAGVVLATVSLHVNLNPYFAERTPWPIASVRLDAGVTVLAHAAGELAAGRRVHVVMERDPAGRRVMVAGANAAPPVRLFEEEG